MINTTNTMNSPYNLTDPASAASRAEIMDAKLDREEAIANEKETAKYHEQIMYTPSGNQPRSKASILAALVGKHGAV